MINLINFLITSRCTVSNFRGGEGGRVNTYSVRLLHLILVQYDLGLEKQARGTCLDIFGRLWVIYGHFGWIWLFGWFWRTVHISGRICNFRSEHARDLILVSIPRFLGMGNPLGPFSNTSDWPEWPNRHLWSFLATKNIELRCPKIANFIP